MNKVTIKLWLNELGLRKFKTIPTFKNLLHQNQLDILKCGDNSLIVNQTVYGKIKRCVEYDNQNMKI